MKITFLGGAGGVTGANHLLEIQKMKMIIDCGLFQSGKFVDELNHQNFAYDPSSVQFAFITHAHLDHVGRLPKLYEHGFRGTIYATEPTCELARLILEDSCSVMEHESKDMRHSSGRVRRPFTCKPEVDSVMKLFHAVKYREKIQLAKDVEVVFDDAGHILGSSTIQFTDKKAKKSIIFSGDFGNVNKPILRDPVQAESADYVVVESVYGDKKHESARSKKLILAEIFLENMRKKGVLMIPAFSLERTQELLYYFNELIEKHNFPKVPMFLDSPLAIKITKVFKKFPDYYDAEAKELTDLGDDFLHFEGLQLTESVQQSKGIARIKGPKVVIAGSGMMHAGRILHHLVEYLPNKNNTLLIVGFQVRGSLGRRLLEGATRVRINHRDVPVRARVKAIGAMSAHADSDHLLQWVKNIKGVKKTFVVQGDPDAANFLTQRINRAGISAVAPSLGYSEELL